jgi:thiol-disulfide isomerase/thioredoxin
MRCLLLLTILSCLSFSAFGDIHGLSDHDFDQFVKDTEGKVFVQFWSQNCLNSLEVIPDYIKVEEALGGGEEGIWTSRVELIRNPDLKERFGIWKTPTYIYIADGKFYNYGHDFMPDKVLEFVRGGYKSYEGFDIPISKIQRKIEDVAAKRREWVEKAQGPVVVLLDSVFGEPDVSFLERRSVKRLRNNLAAALLVFALVYLLVPGRRQETEEKKD